MHSDDPLDDLLRKAARRFGSSRTSSRLGTIRKAYAVGVPALLMKSNTDRLGEAAGYAFHLGTPDSILRRIASWVLTECESYPRQIWRIHDSLWGRHGREDVALAALLLANAPASDSDRWRRLGGAVKAHDRVAVEALLLSVEEMIRAGRAGPNRETIEGWFDAGGVLANLALLVVHAFHGSDSGEHPEWLRERVLRIDLPPGDSLMSRVRERLLAE